MITTEEAMELDGVVREVMRATEEASIARATGFVPAGFRESRMTDAIAAYNAFVKNITNLED